MPEFQEPADPVELALVVKALTSGLSDCVEWRDVSLMNRVRNDPGLGGLRPQHIRRDLIEAVAEFHGTVVQVREKRPEFVAVYPFYYKVILAYNEEPFEVFVELILNDPDPDCPSVTIVSVHAQRRN